ncbi:SERTA domain-containing protein 4 isoform X2 [Takifugu rubripes]|uniref:SERTA domain-containing protein 4 isoform X2 n=1 Tax=Takifugu rubripes TaxID=31033 RepID=UPI001145CA6B|nr:SERTA domain-containing protein 4 isoform X2 [Takifugu rubripes]
MTLVLSMNPFLDPEGEPPLSMCKPIWEPERCTKACLSSPASACSSEGHFPHVTPSRRVPDHLSVSRISYFKRKFVDDDDSPSRFRTYCQTVAPFLEERAHVLRLSLEKMRFIDDPEAFLRRSVLVNNLLRRLRAEILLQSSDWCFPPGPTFAPPPCAPPASSSPPLHTAMPTSVCLAPPAGPPFRKRFRMLSGGQVDLQPDCAQTCCCIYAAAAAAGHYLHLPFSMYDAALSSCPSTPHSSSLFQLGNHSKLGLTVAVEEHDEEEEDVEEEEDEENEEEDCGEREEEEEEEDDDDGGRTPAGSSFSGAKDKTSHQSRTKMFQVCAQTRTEEDMTEVEEEEQEEKEEIVRSCQWTSQKELRKRDVWDTTCSVSTCTYLPRPALTEAEAEFRSGTFAPQSLCVSPSTDLSFISNTSQSLEHHC